MATPDVSRAASFGLAAGVTGTSAGRADSGLTTTRRQLVVAQAGEPLPCDLQGSTLSNDWPVAFNLLDTLERRHPDGTLHPAPASAWDGTAPAM